MNLYINTLEEVTYKMWENQNKELENFEDFIENDHLYNFENYNMYEELVRTGSINIFTKDITDDNLDMHFFGILNIFRDGIEADKVHNMEIHVHFMDDECVKLSAFYYFYNLMLWKLPLASGDPLTSEFLYFPMDLTTKSIKEYIDVKFIEKHQTNLSIRKLNNIIDDTMWKYKFIDEFHKYLLNTINNEDTIDMMKSNAEFNSYIHADLSNVPMEDIKDVGMKMENNLLDIIKNSDHCLRDAARTGQGINPRQHKEFTVNIGTKPDGNGSVYPHSINSSFANGGLQSRDDLLVDSGASRLSQILSKENVGDSGHYSRILGLNNQGSRIHDDPDFICTTKNLMKVTIKNEKILNMYKNRWFRFTPGGIEYNLGSSPLKYHKELIGRTLYFRSPMTCASAARGHGICYRCYGNLAYVNYSLSAGKIAAEILCSILTQMLLSSKHLLESKIVAMNWNDAFYETMEVNINMLCIKNDLPDLEQYWLEVGNITFDDEYDQFDYNSHVTSFNVVYPGGYKKTIKTDANDNIYLGNELLELISNIPETEDETFLINFKDLKDTGIFLIKLSNIEISRALDKLTSMIKNSDGMEGKPKEKVLEDLIDEIIEDNINIDAVHLETLLSNQIRKSYDDILEMPEWEYENAEYCMLGLSKALTDHPSVTVSLQFEKQSKALYYPLNYKKTKPHSTDLFFMTQPHILGDVKDKDPNRHKKLFSKVEKKDEL